MKTSCIYVFKKYFASKYVPLNSISHNSMQILLGVQSQTFLCQNEHCLTEQTARAFRIIYTWGCFTITKWKFDVVVRTLDPVKAMYFSLQDNMKGRIAQRLPWSCWYKKCYNRSREVGIWWQMVRSAGSVHPALFGPYSETTRINTYCHNL